LRLSAESRPQSRRVLANAIISLLLAGACSSGAGPSVSESPVQDALGHYEQIRAALASDDGSHVPAISARLAQAAREAAANAPGTTEPALRELSGAAEALGALSSSDLGDLRIAFGDVSRAVVSLIVADPSLADGRYIFRCPMTMGYKKWVQTSADLENPYMGSRMLHCGSGTKWVR
jgi:hypothetical protein